MLYIFISVPIQIHVSMEAVMTDKSFTSYFALKMQIVFEEVLKSRIKGYHFMLLWLTDTTVNDT